MILSPTVMMPTCVTAACNINTRIVYLFSTKLLFLGYTQNGSGCLHLQHFWKAKMKNISLPILVIFLKFSLTIQYKSLTRCVYINTKLNITCKKYLTLWLHFENPTFKFTSKNTNLDDVQGIQIPMFWWCLLPHHFKLSRYKVKPLSIVPEGTVEKMLNAGKWHLQESGWHEPQEMNATCRTKIHRWVMDTGFSVNLIISWNYCFELKKTSFSHIGNYTALFFGGTEGNSITCTTTKHITRAGNYGKFIKSKGLIKINHKNF